MLNKFQDSKQRLVLLVSLLVTGIADVGYLILVMSLSGTHSSGSYLLDVEVTPYQEDRTAMGKNSENGAPKE